MAESNLVDQFSPARVLGIESSCDETAAAVVENGRVVLSNLVASQVDLHARYGGVFPEVASRQHILAIYPIIEESLHKAHLGLEDLDAIAVTRGPGLPGALVVGMNAAKGLALSSGLPLVGVNHLEAHVYSAWIDLSASSELVGEDRSLSLKPEPRFPLLALIVSGGHTELVLVRGHLQYESLGATLDDAAGEAFDKVARVIGLGYPGGPAIQRAAEDGDPQAFTFPRSWLEDTWNFSFSGIKTAVLREVQRLQSVRTVLPAADLAASFQAAVVDVLVTKSLKAAQKNGAVEILVAGGVSANQALRQAFTERSPLPVHIPHISLCTDNAAMIASAGYYRYVLGEQIAQDSGSPAAAPRHTGTPPAWQAEALKMDCLPNWSFKDL